MKCGAKTEKLTVSMKGCFYYTGGQGHIEMPLTEGSRLKLVAGGTSVAPMGRVGYSHIPSRCVCLSQYALGSGDTFVDSEELEILCFG